jgi:hypothetical protein
MILLMSKSEGCPLVIKRVDADILEEVLKDVDHSIGPCSTFHHSECCFLDIAEHVIDAMDDETVRKGIPQ